MRVRKPVSALAVALIAVVSALVALPSASAATSEAQTAGRMFSLINNYRADSGLAPLAWNPQIGSVAQEWTAGSAVGAERSGAYTYGHNPTLPAGYPAGSQGWSENIVWNYDVDQAFSWWVNSGPHNSNMLNPSFTDIGIGAVRLTAGPNEGAYLITADFGTYPGGGGQQVAPAPQPVVDDSAEKAKQEAAAREESERIAAEKAAAERAAVEKAESDRIAAEKAAAEQAAAEKAEADRVAAEKAAAERAAAEKAAAEKAAAEKAAAGKAGADPAAEKAAAEKAAAAKAEAERIAAEKAAVERAAAEKAAAAKAAAEKAAQKAAAEKAAAETAAAEKAAAEKAAAEKVQPVVEPVGPANPDASVEGSTPSVDETVSEPAPAQLPAANDDENAGEDSAASKPATRTAPVKTAPVKAAAKAPAVVDPRNAANLTEANRGSFAATPRGSLLTLSGLEPNAAYGVVLHSNTIDLGTVSADSAGILSIDIPAELPAGDHRVALSLGAEFVGWQPFSVEESVTVLGAAAGTETGLGAAAPTADVSAAMPAGAAGGELAATGLASWQLLTAVLGTLLVVAGTAAVVMAQRRTRQV